MEQKYGKRYKPPQRPRLRDCYDSVLFGGFFRQLPERIQIIKKSCQSRETFFRFLRETEKLIWIKLTWPKGIYYVKEIEPGQFEITGIEISYLDHDQEKH